ncbi:MAG: hypothetical protein H6745_05410 [Deltaproteobacteria bacterium]|nr:hypothetical protein [Deltaproteobacteria bacterium]
MSRALLAAAALVALTACDAAVPVDGARGEPLLSLDADLVTQAVPPGARVALGLFWLPPGADALDRAQWREDAARPAAAVALDAPLVVRLFAPPPADVALGRPFVLGALVAYDDADGDGRLGPGEAVLGGAPRDFVLWAPAPVAAVGSPLRRDVGPGFHAVAVTDLGCPTRLVEAAPSCGDELGRACATDADCGSDGLCATVVDGRPVPGGVCAKRSTCASPRVRRGGRVASLDAFVLGCERDDACRTAEGHACVPVDYGTWGCLPPAERLCDAPVGAACARDADCGADGRCETASPIYGALPGGYCVVPGDAACRPIDGLRSPLRGGEAEPFLRECLTDADCRRAEGYVCDQRPYRSVCVPETPGACAAAGRSCDDDGDCGASATCAADAPAFGPLPGGMCLLAHGAGGCVWGAAGWSTLGDDGLYYRSGGCGADAACRVAEGYWCNLGAETCVPPPSGACGVPVGAACARDADCGDGGSCVLEVRLATGAVLPVPGGHCRAALGASGCTLADGVWDAAYDGQLGLLARCGADGDCRAGWACDGWLDACLPPRRVAVAIGAFPAFEVPVCR